MSSFLRLKRSFVARSRFPSSAVIVPAVFLSVLASAGPLAESANAGVGVGGSEFQVNSTVLGEQGYPKLASRAGGFVVVWESDGQDGSASGIVGRRLDVIGNPIGSEFQINTYTTDAQDSASVASDAAGNFIVVWESFGQDGSTDGVFARRFAVDATPIGTEFLVNSSTINSQDDPRVAVDLTGDFAIAWEAFNHDGSAASVVVQRYSSAGVKLGGEILVNSYTTGAQLDPDIAMDAFGNFVIVWTSMNQDGSLAGIFGQRFDSDGTPQGTEFRANTFTTGTQDEASVAADLAGSFTIVWESHGQDGNANGVFAQRYNTVGSVVGTEFQVNTVSSYSQDDAAVSMDVAGGFTIAWESIGQDGGLSNGVFLRSFDGGGVPLSGDVQVNVTTTDSQDDATIAVGPNGSYAVAWNSFGQDGDLGAVVERHFVDGAVTTTTTTLPADVCAPAPHSGCKLAMPGRSKFTLKLKPNGQHALSWKYQRGDATDIGEFLDPHENPGSRHRLCVYDGQPTPQPVFAAELPTASLCDSKPCWNVTGSSGYKYRDRDGTPDGITRAKLRSGAAKKSQVHMKGEGANLGVPALPLVFPVVVQLVADDGSASNCWQTQFGSPLMNTSTQLKAKGP